MTNQPEYPFASPSAPAAIVDQDLFFEVLSALPPARQQVLLGAFISDLERLSAEVGFAFRDRNTAHARRAMHSLAGAAGNLGAHAVLTAITALRAAPVGDAEPPLDELALAVTQTIAFVREIASARFPPID
jgi:hypothetical protein